jgi:uncharacterized protein
LTPVQIVPPPKNVEDTRGTYPTNPRAARFRIPDVERESTPALYRTRITHLRRAPVHHYFEHTGYSWYVDLDQMPKLPRWLRPFARFDNSLRQRVERHLADRGIDLQGGTITALIQAKVLGYGFNPLSLYWCHDVDGELRFVVAEVHNTYGDRHAYLLPYTGDRPAMVRKTLYASPFNPVDGYYLVHAPRPEVALDVRISLHREDQPAFIATLRGARRQATIGELLRLQVISPLAPLMGALGIRVQSITLRLRGLPVVPRPIECHEKAMETPSLALTTAKSR